MSSNRLKLPLLLDENLASRELLERLRAAGFDVVISPEALGHAASDRAVFAFARREKRAVVTADCADFAELHRDNRAHAGLFLVFHDGDRRDMSPAQIVASLERAIAHYDGHVASLTITLNAFRAGRR